MPYQKRSVLAFIAVAMLGGCNSVPNEPFQLPAANVAARGETIPVGTVNEDAADDPAIWKNPSDPAKSLIVGTDKKAGLYVYGLDGNVLDFNPAGQLNNVDLIGDDTGALVIASDRGDRANSQIALFRLSAAGKLNALGKVASGIGEAYGLCFQKHALSDSKPLIAFAAIKDGTIREIFLSQNRTGAWQSEIRRSWKVPSQIEGCVTNPRNGDLFVGEENVGIWKIQTSRTDAQPELFANVGAEDGLVADVEGLAFALRSNAQDFLIASSQGDNAYTLFNAETGLMVGRFRISSGAVDGTSETDGIELLIGDIPGYSGGLFVAQDGDNAPEAQNFKLVSWDDILKALELN